METKICSKCNKEKLISEFPKCSRNKDGLDTHCKECRNLVNKNYRDNNKNSFSNMRRKHYAKNRVRLLEQKSIYAAEHKQQKAEYDKQYRQRNKKRIRAYQGEWNKKSIKHKIVRNLRRRVHHALKGETKSESTLSLLGCSINYLKEYLESKFQQGMTWDNYGEWHIDHIKPCSAFDLSDPVQQKECFAYTNLQPLWAIDNLKKAYKYEEKKSNRV